MYFAPDQLYHVYNQGNNKQRIFYTRDNYLFFLSKLQRHLLPHCSILAWCLMPNHFHLMLRLKDAPSYSSDSKYSPGDYKHDVNLIYSPGDYKHDVNLIYSPGDYKHDVNPIYSPGDYKQDVHSHPVSKDEMSKRVSKEMATILRSYTRAINNQENRTGSLFRERTKAVCITCTDGVAKNWYMINGVTVIKVETPERQYPQICYRYILNNPVAARLVTRAQDWEFSSARDVMGLREGTLIDREVIKEYGLTF
ncbi:transposase [Saccharicrinis sp. GN24d3]|uniref:transposase n=1 Tax=Saccharicrinis sp. GN24d3 TaxID=3458416 RepID=UPI00403732FD